ncbi:MAG: hypothetical protein P9M07_04875 [Candidatus Aceula meridiana]|nr:hypothetical protein [Candidatus Aceula meridiana]
MNENAERLFTTSWINATQKIHQISQFRRAYFSLENEINGKFQQEAERFVSEMEKGSQYDSIFIDKKGFFDSSGGSGEIAKSMAKLDADNTKNFFDASVLIFAHSVIDSFLYDMIKVVKEVSVLSFAGRYGEKKVKFLDIQKKEEEIISEFIEKEKLERKSLLDKIDILFALCEPPKGYQPIRDYLFDIEEIKKMDACRNQAVHEDVSSLGDKWTFDSFRVSQALSYFMCLVHEKFNVKINPTLWKESLKEKAKHG